MVGELAISRASSAVPFPFPGRTTARRNGASGLVAPLQRKVQVTGRRVLYGIWGNSLVAWGGGDVPIFRIPKWPLAVAQSQGPVSSPTHLLGNCFGFGTAFGTKEMSLKMTKEMESTACRYAGVSQTGRPSLEGGVKWLNPLCFG